jgi:hypothetical protein
MFNCRRLSPFLVVLEADYSEQCNTEIHQLFEILAGIVVVSVAFGIPLGFAWVLITKSRASNAPEVRKMAAAVSDALNVTHTEAADVIHEMLLGKDYGFLLKAFRSNCFIWEIFDMIRKLILVGILVLVDRGSVAQVVCAACLSFLFTILHFNTWPYKLLVENRLNTLLAIWTPETFSGAGCILSTGKSLWLIF